MNVTVPVAAEGDVVAVRVMLEPATGLAFDTASVVDDASEPETNIDAEVLVAYVELPPYIAV
jgi:hypothetical protein